MSNPRTPVPGKKLENTVSADDVASHKEFCNKFSFTIDLLADPNHELLQAAGVGQGDYKGTMYWDRTSFVIEPEGTLEKNLSEGESGRSRTSVAG